MRQAATTAAAANAQTAYQTYLNASAAALASAATTAAAIFDVIPGTVVKLPAVRPVNSAGSDAFGNPALRAAGVTYLGTKVASLLSKIVT